MTSVYSFIISDVFSFYGVYSCRDEAALNCSVNKGGFVPAFMLLQLLNITGLFFHFVFGTTAPQWTRASSFTRFLDHTQRRTTVGRTPLDEWSARRRDLYLTTHKTLTTDKHPCPRWDSNPQSQQASGRRPTPLDCAVAGTGLLASNGHKLLVIWHSYCQHVSVRGHTRGVCVNTFFSPCVWCLIYFQSWHHFFEIVPIWFPCKKNSWPLCL